MDDIARLLEALNHGKVRERNEALKDLTTTLKSRPEHIPTRAIQDIIEVLLSIIEPEHRKYCDALGTVEGPKGAVEERLSAIAYIIRLFVEKVAPRFKQKSVNYCLAVLPLMAVTGHGANDVFVEPTAVHLTYAVLCIVQSQPFQLKFTAERWGVLVEQMCSLADKQIRRSIADRALSNTLLVLAALVKLDTLALVKGPGLLSLHATTVSWLRKSSKETGDTVVVMEIVNRLLSATSTNNAVQALHLIHETWRFLSLNSNASAKSINKELTYHFLVAGELINHKLPEMIGVRLPNFQDEEFVYTVKEILRQRLRDYEPERFNAESVEFVKTEEPNLNWVTFRDIRAVDDDARGQWTPAVSLLFLLESYFELKQATDRTAPIFKKTRTTAPLMTLLDHSNSIESFFLGTLMEDGLGKDLLTVLQLFTLHAARMDMKEIHLEELKDLILKYYNSDDLAPWCSIALTIIVQQNNFKLSEADSIRIFKQVLPLIKTPLTCRSACVLISQVIKFGKSVESASTIKTQIYDVYELSDVNGPAYACNESYNFWKALQYYGSNYKSRDKHSVTSMIIKWLYSKWVTIFENDYNRNQLYTFIIWMTGVEDVDCNARLRESYDIREMHFNRPWMEKIELEKMYRVQRNFLFQFTPKIKTHKQETDPKKLEMNNIDSKAVTSLVYKCLDMIEKINNNPTHIRLKWTFQILPIVDILESRPEYEDVLENVKITMVTLQSSLKFDTRLAFATYFEEILRGGFRYSEFHRHFKAAIVFEHFRRRYFPQEELKEDVDNEFEKISPRKSNDSSRNSPVGDKDENFVDDIILAAVALYAVGLNDFQTNLGSTFARFFSTLNPQLMMDVLSYLHKYLEIIRYLPLQFFVPDFEIMTSAIGSTLLGSKFNTSNKSMEALSNFLLGSLHQWLYERDSPISLDCIDILDWLNANLEKGSFSGVQAVKKLATLLLSILQRLSVSRHPPKGMKQRIFDALLKTFKKLDHPSLICFEELMETYMRYITYTNQKIFSTELIKLFDTPQQSIEMSSSYMVTLTKIGSVSYWCLINSLLEMLSFDIFEHSKYYIKQALPQIALNWDMNDVNQLFDKCKFELLLDWIKKRTSISSDLEPWDITLFNFESIDDMFSKFSKEIGAIYIASGCNNREIIERVLYHGYKNEADIFIKTFQLTIPLAFVADHIGSLIFDVGKQLLGNNMGSYERKSELLVFKNFIGFLDFGNIETFNSVLQRFYSEVNSFEFYCKDEISKIYYQYPTHIDLLSGIKFAQSYFSRDHFLTAENCNLLIWMEMTELEKSKDENESIKHLREIQYILIHFSKVIPKCNGLNEIIRKLAPYIQRRELDGDVVPPMVILLNAVSNSNGDKILCLPVVYLNMIAKCRVLHERVSHAIVDAIGRLVRSTDICRDNIWQKCFQYLSIDGDIELCNDDILTVLENELIPPADISFVSLLLGDDERIIFEPESPTIGITGITKLLEAKIDPNYVSRRFTIFQAQCFKFYYQDNALNEKKSTIGILSDSCSEIFNGSVPYFTFFEEFTKFSDNKEIEKTSETILLTETINKFVVNIRDRNASGPGSFNENLTTTQMDQFDGIFHDWMPSLDIAAFLEDEHSLYTDTLMSWLTKLSESLLKIIALNVPSIAIFNPLSYSSSEFNKKTFHILFTLAIFYDPRGFMEWYPKYVSLAFSMVSCIDYPAKLDAFLSTIFIIRYGSKAGNRCCSKVYDDLDLERVCQLTLDTEYAPFGLLIFEETHTSSDVIENHTLLSELYASIGDKDLQSGLPPAHSLMEAFDRTTMLDYNPWNSFVLSNAKFDVTQGEASLSSTQLLRSISERNGFYGFVNKLDPAYATTNEEDQYFLEFNLGKWDLPVPNIIKSTTSGLYYSLKTLGNDGYSAVKSLESSLMKLTACRSKFDNQTDWILLISELNNLVDIMKTLKEPESLVSVFNSSSLMDDKLLKSVNYTDYKPMIQSRYKLLATFLKNERLSQNYNPMIIKLASICALKEEIKASLRHHVLQDTLRNSFILHDMGSEPVLSDENKDIQTLIGRFISFNSAVALWESGDFKTPIRMMNDLVQTDLDLTQHVNSELYPFMEELNIHADVANSYLVKWYAASRMETSNDIYKKHIIGKTISVQNATLRADAFYTFGTFLNNQIKSRRSQEDIDKYRIRCRTGHENIQALKIIYNNEKLPEQERKDAKRHHFKVRLQLERDEARYNELRGLHDEFIWGALQFFQNTLITSNAYDADVMDRFCALWFENSHNDELNEKLVKDIGSIPIWKFLTWVNQISSKLNNDNSAFQALLEKIMKRLLYKIPYESLYPVISIKLYKTYSVGHDASISGKIAAVEKILTYLESYDQGSFYKKYVLPVTLFCEKSVELASFKIREASKSIKLKNLKLGDYWLNQLPLVNLPVPTEHIVINNSNDGRKERPYITSVSDTIRVTATGVSLPKIVTFTTSEGYQKQVLMKGSNDDLRQDAIMEQVFAKVNNILMENSEFRKLNLRMRTYQVVPLGPRAGIIEFVDGSTSLHQVLRKYHDNDKIRFEDARRSMKSVQSKSHDERLKVYTKLTQNIEPQLRKFFFDNFLNYEAWFEAKNRYTRGVAINSIVGYILGLGDRHLNNILLDLKSGEPIHIDLGIAFDQGKLLPIPELVPFRLTRDVIDGFGVTGVEGMFKRNCERVYSSLRKDSDKVMCILNVLKWDPLYSWVMSPVTKHRHLLEDDTDVFGEVNSHDRHIVGGTTDTANNNQESVRALRGVEEKLNGNGLRIEAIIEGLIQEATSPDNLATIYMGWTPFY